jgi:predicted dithiol-disulfide oxidoreductase (DUF899 family)
MSTSSEVTARFPPATGRCDHSLASRGVIAWTAACPACTTLADHFDPMLPHLRAHDITLICASHAPLDKLQAYKQRMGWKFPLRLLVQQRRRVRLRRRIQRRAAA